MAATDWIVLTEDDLKDYATGVRISAMLAGQRAAGVSGVFARVMQPVATRIRVAIAAANQPVHKADYAVPPETRDHAVWLVIEQLAAGLEGFEFSKSDLARIEKAEKYVEGLKSGANPITPPDGADAITLNVSRAGNVLSSESENRTFTRDAMKGY